MSRIFVLTVATFVVNVNAMDIGPIMKGIEGIFNEDVAKTAYTGLGIAGGIKLIEQLEKQNPVAKAFAAVGAGSAVGGTRGGLAAGTTSLIISCVPDSIKKSISNKLPECCTSEGAKTTAHIVFSAAVGYYCGDKVKAESGMEK
jgi:hypothetical protein